MNCASVGTKNLGNTGVWTRNTKNTIVVAKITSYAHFCCKNHKVGTFVSKITIYAHFCCKNHKVSTFVSKITTYAFFCHDNHNICALLWQKSQHTRTLIERKKIGLHKKGTGEVTIWLILFTKFSFFFKWWLPLPCQNVWILWKSPWGGGVGLLSISNTTAIWRISENSSILVGVGFPGRYDNWLKRDAGLSTICSFIKWVASSDKMDGVPVHLKQLILQFLHCKITQSRDLERT